MSEAARRPRTGSAKKTPKAPTTPNGVKSAAPKRRKKATNLTLDPAALARGERFAERHGTSLSQVVNAFLSALPSPELDPELGELTPAVQRLYGLAVGGTADRDAYRDHLLEKYGSARS